eukprot:TRINITY_DN49_c0_g2_i1.p2 TRINITY_DN49_c0_g2~~TRINITY_DN49_c0_g2_i1.p2  ORF type:complete len:375 (-),score=172.80 TRINITY_DN49_c0_g2_i1:18-1142(-)
MWAHKAADRPGLDAVLVQLSHCQDHIGDHVGANETRRNVAPDDDDAYTTSSKATGRSTGDLSLSLDASGTSGTSGTTTTTTTTTGSPMSDDYASSMGLRRKDVVVRQRPSKGASLGKKSSLGLLSFSADDDGTGASKDQSDGGSKLRSLGRVIEHTGAVTTTTTTTTSDTEEAEAALGKSKSTVLMPKQQKERSARGPKNASGGIVLKNKSLGGKYDLDLIDSSTTGTGTTEGSPSQNKRATGGLLKKPVKTAEEKAAAAKNRKRVTLGATDTVFEFERDSTDHSSTTTAAQDAASPRHGGRSKTATTDLDDSDSVEDDPDVVVAAPAPKKVKNKAKAAKKEKVKTAQEGDKSGTTKEKKGGKKGKKGSKTTKK